MRVLMIDCAHKSAQRNPYEPNMKSIYKNCKDKNGPVPEEKRAMKLE